MNETLPNVYDFDKTIVYPDGGATFFFFCLRRHPALLRFLPGQILALLRFVMRHGREAPFKAEYYRYLRGLRDWREDVRVFWETQSAKLLKPWYLAQLRPDDIIVSCSAEFFLRPLCERLGVRVVGTLVDTETGLLEGYSCYGPEKLRRLREAFEGLEIGGFYSDSLSDAPLAALARQAWLVKGDKVTPWPEGGK
ncbi:MAG: haloacid dehalogenase-like hydrolase [Firmicutes bacterium]|nr:haloacid dehalogenase-like hydrolase [Bacillota bacterium]